VNLTSKFLYQNGFKISILAAKKRRKSKAKNRRKTSRAKSKSKRKPFGGYAIKFAGRNETLEQIFGNKPVTPSEMTKKIWSFIKSKRLATR
jgi:chromatin remodeling complex protein RSC6